MLAITLFDLHVQGGMEYMSPLSILFIINVVLLVIAFIRVAQGKPVQPVLTETIKQIGNLIMAWGVFGTLIGFLQMFDALESMKETLPLNIISGGVKVALLTVIYGSVLYCINLCAYIILIIRVQKQKINEATSA